MKLIVILGQTSSGKSAAAIEVAKKLENSWVVNCDSRQIYTDLNLGTGKILGNWETRNNLTAFYSQGIPHFLIDYVDPFQKIAFPYDLNRFVQDFENLFQTKKPEYVILTGGSGLYAKAIYKQLNLNRIKPEFEEEFSSLKASLRNRSLKDLQELLQKEAPAEKLNESDSSNPPRIVSRILQNLSKKNQWAISTSYPQFVKTFIFALKAEGIEEKITSRIHERWQQGLIQEVINLQSLGFDKLISLGLEYRLITLFLRGLLTEKELELKLIKENLAYSKRQLTWLNKEPVAWVSTAGEILKQIG